MFPSSSISSSSSTHFPSVSERYKSLLDFVPTPSETTPAVILLDSLGGYHKANQVLPITRSYIVREWRYRKNGGQPIGGIDTALTLYERNLLFEKLIPEASPECQIQDNGTDCGLFTLKFVESIVNFSRSTHSPIQMQLPAESITQNLLSMNSFPKTIKSWFNNEDVYHLRAIMKAVCNMCKGSDESGDGESNLQKLSHSRKTLMDDGVSALEACKLLALDSLSENQRKAVRLKKKEIENEMLRDKKREESKLLVDHQAAISVDNSDDEVQEVKDDNMEERKVAVGSISSSLSVFKNSKKRLFETEIKEEKEEKVP
jgi:hypothetical protein